MTIIGPTMFYHRTEAPRVVSTEAEYAALGEGWADTPAAFYEAPATEWNGPAMGGEPCGKDRDGLRCVSLKGHRGAHAYREAVQ